MPHYDEVEDDEVDEPECCCGCMLISNGTYAAGMFSLLTTALQVAYLVTYFPEMDLTISYAICAVVIFVVVLLFMGVCDRRPCLMLPYLIIEWIELCYNFGLIILGAIILNDVDNARWVYPEEFDKTTEDAPLLGLAVGGVLVGTSTIHFLVLCYIIDTIIKCRTFFKKQLHAEARERRKLRKRHAQNKV